MQSEEIRFRRAMALLRKKHPNKPVQRIFDTAASEATTTRLLHAFGCEITANYFQESNYGFDVDESLRAEIESGRVKVAFGECVSVMKGVDSGQYDLVFCGEIIEHIFDLNEFFEECKRILKPGGLVLGTTPNLVSWQNRLRVLLGRSPTSYHAFPFEGAIVVGGKWRPESSSVFDYHIRVGTPALLMRYLRHVGFRDPAFLTTNEYGEERALRGLRRALNPLLPRNLKENISFVASKT